MKIKFFDQKILKTFGIIVGFISSLIGILAVAIEYNKKYSWIWFLSWVIALLLIYILLVVLANKKNKTSFKINGTKINIFIGDIFNQKDGLKVIPMNEYFDTQVDDVVIAKNSLHGKYLTSVFTDYNVFNETVKEKLTPVKVIKERKIKDHQNKYELGSLIVIGDYALTAFTRFDENNRAYLLGKDYLYFWGSFWANLDKVCAGRNVYVPLFGAGLTRFNEYSPTKQELLENMLFALKNSGFRNTYSNKSINIVIYRDDAKEIDFYHIAERFGK